MDTIEIHPYDLADLLMESEDIVGIYVEPGDIFIINEKRYHQNHTVPFKSKKWMETQ